MPHPILKHQLTQDVKLLHKVALVAGEQALILKRSPTASSRPEKWDLPGGNSEWPADQKTIQINLHQQDLVREVQEETGIILQLNNFTIENLVYFATFFEPVEQLYSINCGWVVQLDQGSADIPAVKLSSEHTDYAWINLSQLDHYDFGGLERDYETAIIRKALG